MANGSKSTIILLRIQRSRYKIFTKDLNTNSVLSLSTKPDLVNPVNRPSLLPLDINVVSIIDTDIQQIYNFLEEIVGRKLVDRRVSVRPDAPEPPKPDRITKDSVTLSWRPPRSDGGAKIRGYIIQMKQRGQDEWDDVNGALIPTNVYTVPKLTEGEEYLFRVIAVNDVGNSDPSRPSNPIVIEEQPNKPVMDLGGVRDITVRAGEDFSIHVPYIGFPKPTATWYANDVIKDETDPRVHQQLGDDYAR